jgi:hypothetical protein
VQIAPETCRANVVKKEIKNIVHVVELELNIRKLKIQKCMLNYFKTCDEKRMMLMHGNVLFNVNN